MSGGRRAGFPSTACLAAESQSAPRYSPAGAWMGARPGRRGGDASPLWGPPGRGTGLGAPPAGGSG